MVEASNHFPIEALTIRLSGFDVSRGLLISAW